MKYLDGLITTKGLTYNEFLLLIRSKPNKHDTLMEHNKVRVWDKLQKRFFQTKYDRNGGDITELLMSQEGEIYLREKLNGVDKLIHEGNLEFKDRFIKNLYVGIRDSNDKKYFINDIVKFTTRGKGGNPSSYSFGVLIWDRDCLGIGSGPIGDYTAIDRVSERDLREAENVGNIYQDAKIIMGDIAQ